MFAENLKAAMDAALMTATDLASLAGISNASISLYLSGKSTPRRKVVEKLACALDVDVPSLLREDADEIDVFGRSRMTVAEAAKLMDVGEQFIRIGLQQGLFPFGFAIRTTPDGKRLQYYISRKKFSEYTGIAFPKGDNDGKAANIL